MATVILVRHGRTTANAAGVLAGRPPGVRLDDVGRDQAARTGERLAAVPLAAVVTSPLERCRQTAAAIVARPARPAAGRHRRGLTECDYGDWQGRPLKELAKEKLWKTVQTQPSAATFPGGESMAAMQARAVAAVRRRDAAVEAEHGPGAVWVAVSHGDIIKSVLADALGHAPRPVPADPRRPGVGLDRPVHRRPARSCWPPTPTPATCPGWPAAAEEGPAPQAARRTPRSAAAPGPTPLGAS